MPIKFEGFTNQLAYQDLRNGEIFRYGEYVWVKLDHSEAVNLIVGGLKILHFDVEVTRVKIVDMTVVPKEVSND